MKLTPFSVIIGLLVLVPLITLLLGGWGSDPGSWAIGVVSSLVAAALLNDTHNRAVADEDRWRREDATGQRPEADPNGQSPSADLPSFTEELDIGAPMAPSG